MTAFPALRSLGLDAFWGAVRARLERADADGTPTGRVRLPDLTSADRLALSSLLERPPGKTVALDALEVALARLGVGADLAEALAALGHPVSGEPAQARAERRQGRDARAAARAEIAAWSEPWSAEWVDDVIRAGILRGLDPDAAVAFVRSVRQVLDHLDAANGTATAPADLGGPDETHTEPARPVARPIRDLTGDQGRVDVAAAVLGDAHALDTGSRLEAAATRALAHLLGPAPARDLWERAGAHLDLTSGPALTWNLRLPSTHPLTAVLDAGTAAGVPIHLTQFALRRHPITAVAAPDILLVENPRVAEAAAQLGVAGTVIATNGNPSGAVQLLVAQLLASGAHLRYHGDFDTAGLTLCARMARLGVEPWRMGADDYAAAVAEAAQAGVDLPPDDGLVPATPWDPLLAEHFEHHRRVVHEERLLPALLLPPA